MLGTENSESFTIIHYSLLHCRYVISVLYHVLRESNEVLMQYACACGVRLIHSNQATQDEAGVRTRR